jgi:hypothetical protein
VQIGVVLLGRKVDVNLAEAWLRLHHRHKIWRQGAANDAPAAGHRLAGAPADARGTRSPPPLEVSTVVTGLLRGLVILIACLTAAACSGSRALPGPDRDAVSLVSRGCAHISRHQYEVCYAYLVNDSLLARVPYYELGRVPSFRQPALTRLDSRYYGSARPFLIRQARHWPRRVDVSVPIIRIVGAVRVSAHLRTATIHTIETWLVRAEPRAGRPGRVLFAERNAHHTIWLERTPTILCLLGHCLHKWVVTRIRFD